MATASVGRTLLKNGLWNNLPILAPIVINIILTPYVLHGFGVDRWGLFLLVSSVSTFLGPLDAGLGGTVGRFFAVYAGTDDRKKTTEVLVTMVTVLTGIGGLVTLVAWFTAPLVIRFFGVHGALIGEGVFLFRTMGGLIGFTFLHNLFVAVLNARQRYAITSVTYTITTILWSAGLVLCVALHLGLRGVGILFLGQQIIASLLITPSALRFLSLDGLHFISFKELKEIVTYASSIQVMGIVALVNNEVDSLLIGRIFRIADVTYYNTGANFGLQLRNVTLSALGPAGTHLANVFGKDGEDEAAYEFTRLQRLWVIMTAGWSAAGTGAAYFAVVAWLGPGFGLAGEVALLGVAGSAFGLWTGMLTQYLSAVGRPSLEMRYAVLSMLVNIVLTAPMALLGPLGVVGATALGSVVASLYLVFAVRRRYRHVRHFLRDIPVVQTLATFGVTIALEIALRPHIPHGPVGLLACAVPAVIGLAVFILLIFGRKIGRLINMLRRRQFAPGPIASLLFESGPAWDLISVSNPTPEKGPERRSKLQSNTELGR